MMMIIQACCLLIIFTFVNKSQGVLFTNDCPLYCVCDFELNRLLISCNQEQPNTYLKLPSLISNAMLVNTVTIVITNSYLNSFPLNFCEYAISVRQIDLSSNLIADSLDQSVFGCMNNLELLNISYNLIHDVNENAFNSLNKLIILDMSHNQLSSIAKGLFFFKLPSLLVLDLSYNQLQELDVWMLFLKSIEILDLSHNQIARFTNQIGWNPLYISPYTQIMSAIRIDLGFNKLTYFDDELLRLFSICGPSEFSYFIQLFKKLNIDGNPFTCSCKRSFNLLRFYQIYMSTSPNVNDVRLFAASCTWPNEYFNFNIFSFENYIVCQNEVATFTPGNCNTDVTTTTGTTTTTVTTTAKVQLVGPQNLIQAPTLNITEEQLPELYTAQKVGIVIGLVGFFFLFLVMLYCVCPIEILSLTFNFIPIFYTFCPCKSGVKRDKEFDLFVSYNKTNDGWIRNKLVPFIKDNYLVSNFILHYNPENINQEVFGPYVREIMNRSSCILFVLSDQFLIKEWNNKEFRSHLRYLITKEKTRFICVQMHDVCDEEVDEYFNDKLQIPRFVSLENDEFLFWCKLAYFLFTNDSNPPKRDKPIPFNNNNNNDSQTSIEWIKYDETTTTINNHPSQLDDLNSLPSYSMAANYYNYDRSSPERASKHKRDKTKTFLLDETEFVDNRVYEKQMPFSKSYTNVPISRQNWPKTVTNNRVHTENENEYETRSCVLPTASYNTQVYNYVNDDDDDDNNYNYRKTHKFAVQPLRVEYANERRKSSRRKKNSRYPASDDFKVVKIKRAVSFDKNS